MEKLNQNRSINERLEPYSLRHGFAFRCHVELPNPISATEFAGFMRQNTNTHNDLYANYTDNDKKERSRARLVGKLSQSNVINQYESAAVGLSVQENLNPNN